MRENKSVRITSMEKFLKTRLGLIEIAQMEIYQTKPNSSFECVLVNFLVGEKWYHVDIGLDRQLTEDEKLNKISEILQQCLKMIRSEGAVGKRKR